MELVEKLRSIIESLPFEHSLKRQLFKQYSDDKELEKHVASLSKITEAACGDIEAAVSAFILERKSKQENHRKQIHNIRGNEIRETMDKAIEESLRELEVASGRGIRTRILGRRKLADYNRLKMGTRRYFRRWAPFDLAKLRTLEIQIIEIDKEFEMAFTMKDVEMMRSIRNRALAVRRHLRMLGPYKVALVAKMYVTLEKSRRQLEMIDGCLQQIARTGLGTSVSRQYGGASAWGRMPSDLPKRGGFPRKNETKGK